MSGPPDPPDHNGPVGGGQAFPGNPPYGDQTPQLPGPGSDHPSGQQWNRFPPEVQREQVPGGLHPQPPSGPTGSGRVDAGIGAALAVAGAWFFWSLCVVAWIGGFFGFTVGWVAVAVWVLSGALTFLRPVEEMIARYLLRLRLPTSAERQRLGPGWFQVAHRAGVDPDRFTIWVQESDDVNATPTPGHTVAVTRWALYTVPAQHLEAVLAHELSHHLGGRAWLSLLSFWYSIPARVTLIAVRALGRLMRGRCRLSVVPFPLSSLWDTRGGSCWLWWCSGTGACGRSCS